MDVHYQAGGQVAVVTDSAIAMLDESVPAEVLESLWRTLVAGGGVGEVLQLMNASFGTSLSSIPPFAVISASSEGVLLAVRGAFTVRVGDRDGASIVSGVGVTTWSERWTPHPDSVEIRGVAAPIGPDAPGDAREYPIASGVVLASGVRLVVRADHPERDSRPESLPVVNLPARVVAPPVDPTVVVPTADKSAPTLDLEPAAVEQIDPELTFAEAQEPTAAPEVPAVPDLVTPEHAAAGVIDHTRVDGADGVEDLYDHLWGPTVMRRVEDAAIRDEDEDEDADDAPKPSRVGVLIADVLAFAPTTPGSGDHDGETIMGGQLAALRAQARGSARPSETPAAPLPTGQTVLARACATGHPNPPQSARCRLCGLDLLGDATRMSRPSLGRVVLSTGEVVELDRPVVVGRKPRVSRVQGADLPRLITVPSPEQDISRSHVEVRFEEWHVFVVDLGTTNGTIVQRAGDLDRRLDPNENFMIRSQDVVDIGDGVTLTFEAIP